jgi:predicted TIM-barrel fold metal-dependent hydrolase
MLTVKIEQNGKAWEQNFFVIDSHSHLGEDVDGAKMMNPLAPGTGTFDFWGNVQGKLVADWAKTHEQSFMTTIKGIPTRISWSFNSFPFTEKLYSALEKIGKKYSDLKEKSRFYAFIDQGVVFPFQDVFRDKHPDALYRASNINVSRFTTRFPFSLKLIGYARVDPMEGEKAVKEVTYAREVLGLRGLKLHPRSERWIDDIKSEKAIKVLIEAASHSMPVIFDTRGRGSILDIAELVKSTRSVIKQQYPELLPHLKVIIAHFAQGNIGDHDVYNAVVQPGVYGDLSMLHGEGAGNFFEDFRKWFNANNRVSVDKRDWSEYLLFASDYPYFGDVHAQKLLTYIINKRFFDTGGTLNDTRNILGLNQLKILPEYSIPLIQKKQKQPQSIIFSNMDADFNSHDQVIKSIAKLLVDNQIDIKKFCFQFNNNWNSFDENILLDINRYGTEENLYIHILKLIPNVATLVAPLLSNFQWNKAGYKFFDPEDRNYFNTIFRNNYLVTNEEQALGSLMHLIINH